MQPSELNGYITMPPDCVGRGVLVLHAWWGLNETIKAFCRRLADSGFIAYAPDLYHGKVARTIAEAEILGKAVDANHLQVKSEIATAAKFLNDELAGPNNRGVAVIGFSLGAYYAVHLAATDPEHIRSVVLFYGTGDSDLSNSKADFLGHYAENDEYEPRANADSMEGYLKRLGRSASFYHYSGARHWFFEPDRVQEFNQGTADLAWKRTLDFLRTSPTTVIETKRKQ